MTFGPVVDVAFLAARLDDPMVRAADCRWYLADPGGGLRHYEEGHIPGAVFVSLDDDLSAPPGDGRHPLPAVADFAASMGRLGIDMATTVVAYDDAGGAIAARLWWMLTELGHERTAVLDGGIDGWKDAGHAVETSEPHVVPTRFETSRDFAPLERDDLLASLGDLVVVDARAPERYRGDEEPVDPVAGHIPGARNLPHHGNLDGHGRFRTAEQLRVRFVGEGISEAAAAAVYCGSGVTACHHILAMELAGLGRAALYSGSWSDWVAHGYPMRTGPEPGMLHVPG